MVSMEELEMILHEKNESKVGSTTVMVVPLPGETVK